MAHTRKEITIIVLLSGILISGISNVFLMINLNLFVENKQDQSDKEILVVGTFAEPIDIDPVEAWDTTAIDVIRQVAECLFFYNLSDPELPLTPLLASNYTWINDTLLEINLREGIKFHDGTKFDSDAVIWNFERLLHFMNHSRTLPSGLSPTPSRRLYEFVDGTPIFKDFSKIGDYSMRIELNRPFTPILGAMSHVACSMLSPTYHFANGHLDRYISFSEADKIEGTGPFKYQDYEENSIKMVRNERYWMDPTIFDELIFKIIDDSNARYQAMLAQDIDWLKGSSLVFFETFIDNPYIIVIENENPGITYHYLEMNNALINVTWRKAISYAINYTYILLDMQHNMFHKSIGPISPGFTNYFDYDLLDKAPYYNLTVARQTLINDLGINTTGLVASDDPDDISWHASSLKTLKYFYCTDRWFEADLYLILKEWLKDIGIILLDYGIDWAMWPCFGYFYVSPDDAALYWNKMGPLNYDVMDTGNNAYADWRGFNLPFYLDPISMIQPLFSNVSALNIAQVNDPYIEQYLGDYISEPLESVRIEIMTNISDYLATQLYPHAFGYHPKVYTVHSADLYNVPYNVAGEFWAYPIKRNLTWDPSK